jgi:uncharacterized protein YqgV (UPF0045/DUF77 family)
VLLEIIADADKTRRQAEEVLKAAEEQATKLAKSLEEAAKYARSQFIKPVADAMKTAIDAHVNDSNARVKAAEYAVEKQAQDFAKQIGEYNSRRVADVAAGRRRHWITVGIFSAALIGLGAFFYFRTEPAHMFDTVIQEQSARKAAAANPTP